ncbi:unnamed protein product [Lactuca saligna]|uniref:Uncharacterized protein n=1 Tax=Lactuca saligna TaxID=75948 RepID=A0AA36ENY3_LACSI|nr:unnamed protein product [Lactuca saligna]
MGKVVVLTSNIKWINEEISIIADEVEYRIGIVEYTDDWSVFKPLLFDKVKESDDEEEEVDKIPETWMNEGEQEPKDGEIWDDENHNSPMKTPTLLKELENGEIRNNDNHKSPELSQSNLTALVVSESTTTMGDTDVRIGESTLGCFGPFLINSSLFSFKSPQTHRISDPIVKTQISTRHNQNKRKWDKSGNRSSKNTRISSTPEPNSTHPGNLAHPQIDRFSFNMDVVHEKSQTVINSDIVPPPIVNVTSTELEETVAIGTKIGFQIDVREPLLIATVGEIREKICYQ